jgi:hypothetical protein
MKTKNQTGHELLELSTAANEEGFSASVSRNGTPVAPQPAWSPYEVWRTRVKTPEQEPAPARRP